MRTITKAVIPAAGFGTRFLPATKAQPKETLPIVDKPVIQFIVEEAAEAGIKDILIITGKNKRTIEDHFDRSLELEILLEQKGKKDLLAQIQRISEMANIYYIRQQEPLGLGHAISCAKSFIGKDPFAVLLGDDLVFSKTPAIGQLIRAYEEKKTTILGVQEVPEADVSLYGIVKPGEADRRFASVLDLVEKPKREKAPSRLAVLGRYILESDIFAALEKTDPGVGGEIQLTDALRIMLAQKPIYAYTFEGRRYDAGSKKGFLEATVDYALSREDLAPDFIAYLKERLRD